MSVVKDVGGHYMVYIDRVATDEHSRACKNEGARLRRWCKKNAPSLIYGHGIMPTYLLPSIQVFPEDAKPDVTYWEHGARGSFWLIRVTEYIDAFKIMMWKG